LFKANACVKVISPFTLCMARRYQFIPISGECTQVKSLPERADTSPTLVQSVFLLREKISNFDTCLPLATCQFMKASQFFMFTAKSDIPIGKGKLVGGTNTLMVAL